MSDRVYLRLSALFHALPLLVLTLSLPAEEGKTPPPKEKKPKQGGKEKAGEKKEKPAPPPGKEGGSAGAGSAPKEKGKNLEIPAGLADDVRKALESALESFKVAEKAEKDRDKAATSALNKLKSAAVKAPEASMPHFYIAQAHELKRNLAEARKSYEKALKMNPLFHEAFSELAEIYHHEKDKKKALELFEKALAIEPSYIPSLQGKAFTLLALGDLTGARDTLAKAQKVQAAPDLSKLIERLERDIKGPDWPTRYTKETENYIVITQVSQEYADEIGTHAELIRRAYNKIFSDIAKPERKYQILVYRDREAYLKGGAPPQSAGYFDPFVRKLVFYKQSPPKETLTTLYHEAFHQYLQDYQEQAPQWFNEGLGDYFGAYEYVREGKREFMRSRPSAGRLSYVQGAIERKLCPPAADLMVMSQAEMYAPAMIGIHYSQAWAMIYFMIEGNKPLYKTTLMNYFKALQKGMDAREAYKATFAKLDMQKFDAEWKGFAMGLAVKRD